MGAEVMSTVEKFYPSFSFTSGNVQLLEVETIGRRRYRSSRPHSAESPDLPWTDGSSSTSAFPGLKNPEKVLQEIKLRDDLKKLIYNLTKEGLCWSFDQEELRISLLTAKASLAFFEHLPLGTELPKVTPDDEGGLVMVWNERSSEPILVIIDSWKLFLVKAAGTQHAEHTAAIPFDGESIPEAVLKALPRKSLA